MNDPAVLLGLAWVKLQQGTPDSGLTLCRKAAEKRPGSAKNALNLGIALTRSGDLTEAEQELNRAIRLDPSLQQAYLALALVYDKQKRMREMVETLDRYLSWNSQNILFRLQKVTITGNPIIR